MAVPLALPLPNPAPGSSLEAPLPAAAPTVWLEPAACPAAAPLTLLDPADPPTGNCPRQPTRDARFRCNEGLAGSQPLASNPAGSTGSAPLLPLAWEIEALSALLFLGLAKAGLLRITTVAKATSWLLVAPTSDPAGGPTARGLVSFPKARIVCLSKVSRCMPPPRPGSARLCVA